MNTDIPPVWQLLARHIAGIGLVTNNLLQIVWDILHKGVIIRRLILGGLVYIGYLIWIWISKTPLANLTTDSAVIIGAIITPYLTLFGAVIKFYGDGRKTPPDTKT